MSKFHINPQTGNAGLCSAKISCPFGDLEKDHYSSKEEATAEYENAMAGAGWLPAQHIQSFTTMNEGEIQEIHLGFRTLMNDLKEMQIVTIELAGKTFTRRGGHLYEGSKRLQVNKKDLENFTEILSDGDHLATTLAAHELARKFGFEGVPKAPSQDKVDIVMTNSENLRIKGSVKAFTGAPPSLMSASQTTAVRFEKKLSQDELKIAKKILADREKNKLHETIVIPRLAQELGFHLDYEHASLENETFRNTLNEAAGEHGPDTMLKALISKRDANTDTPEGKNWNEVLGAFATKAVPTGVIPEDKRANAMIDIHRNGTLDLFYSEDSEKIGEHLADRVFIERAGKPKTQFILEDDVLVVRTFAGLRIKEHSPKK